MSYDYTPRPRLDGEMEKPIASRETCNDNSGANSHNELGSVISDYIISYQGQVTKYLQCVGVCNK